MDALRKKQWWFTLNLKIIYTLFDIIVNYKQNFGKGVDDNLRKYEAKSELQPAIPDSRLLALIPRSQFLFVFTLSALYSIYSSISTKTRRLHTVYPLLGSSTSEWYPEWCSYWDAILFHTFWWAKHSILSALSRSEKYLRELVRHPYWLYDFMWFPFRSIQRTSKSDGGSISACFTTQESLYFLK